MKQVPGVGVPKSTNLRIGKGCPIRSRTADPGRVYRYEHGGDNIVVRVVPNIDCEPRRLEVFHLLK